MRRVVFNFDKPSLGALEELRVAEGAPDLGASVRKSLQINLALQQAARAGFTETYVQNPETGERREVYRSLVSY